MAEQLETIARDARTAARALSGFNGEQRDAALRSMAEVLWKRQEEIEKCNARDIAEYTGRDHYDPTLLRRLDISGEDKFKGLVSKAEQVASLPDPVGIVQTCTRLSAGLELSRTSCPIGVLCVIFESRPDAVVQIAALALKSSNAVILKGGKEAYHSNQILVSCIQEALAAAGLPSTAVQLVSTREEVGQLLKMTREIDLIIPRGGNALCRYVMENTHIPVMGHADGVCSVYLDEAADLDTAVRVVVDSKTQNPAVCNAAEKLLIHKKCLQQLLPSVAAGLHQAGVQFCADEQCAAVIRATVPDAICTDAGPEDFSTEFLKLKIAVKSVDGIEQAVEHINRHSSHHTDCIVSQSVEAAEWFMQHVDSAGVFHNASTRFADGERFGFGAEVGVSTNRIHSRGPMGVEGLLIYKYKLRGDGHCVAEFGGPGKREWLHEPVAGPEADQAQIASLKAEILDLKHRLAQYEGH